MDDLFAGPKVRKGARVRPVVVRQDKDDARYLLVIQGELAVAAPLMNRVIEFVEQLHAEQQDAGAAGHGSD